MYFITTKRMLEVCFFQHTPTFIIEPVSLYGERVGKAERGPAAGAVFAWGTFLKFE